MLNAGGDEVFFLTMSPIWHTVPLARPRGCWVLAVHSHFISLLIVINFFSTLNVNCSSTGVALNGLGFVSHSLSEGKLDTIK
jgi:hypothetical protein